MVKRKYCVYKGRSYSFDEVNDYKIELLSSNSKGVNSGFKEMKFEQGFICQVIFVKEVDIDEIEMAYEIHHRVVYKGKEFEPFSTIRKYVIEDDEISLFSKDYDDVQQYEFYKKEQFVFKKDVPLSQIDALIEIKKPILKFNNMQEVITRIEKKDIKDYIKNIIE